MQGAVIVIAGKSWFHAKGGTLEVEVGCGKRAMHIQNAGGADVVIGIIKIRGLKLFRFMPALLSRCRAVTREAIRFRGTNFMHYSGLAAMHPSQWNRSFGKSRF